MEYIAYTTSELIFVLVALAIAAVVGLMVGLSRGQALNKRRLEWQVAAQRVGLLSQGDRIVGAIDDIRVDITTVFREAAASHIEHMVFTLTIPGTFPADLVSEGDELYDKVEDVLGAKKESEAKWARGRKAKSLRRLMKLEGSSFVFTSNQLVFERPELTMKADELESFIRRLVSIASSLAS